MYAWCASHALDVHQIPNLSTWKPDPKDTAAAADDAPGVAGVVGVLMVVAMAVVAHTNTAAIAVIICRFITGSSGAAFASICVCFNLVII